MPNKEHHELNRLSWNEGTKAHNSHKGDQAAFFRSGGNTLFPEEMQLLGNLNGKSLVHLQCNSGQDSLSIAKHLGANVHGVDISDEAIDFAKKLSLESGISASFVRADVYDWFEQNSTQYDIVFASYGAILWLSNIKEWGKGVAKSLNQNSKFVLVEFHPVFGMFDEDWRLCCDYFGGTYIEFESGIGDYVALTGSAEEIGRLEDGITDFKNPHPGVEYQWGIADVVMALVSAGLTLTNLQEYPYCNGFKPFPDMRDAGNRRFVMAEDRPQNFPLMFSVVAQKR